MRILDDRKSVFPAKFVGNRAEFAPRTVGYLSLIMLGFKGVSCIEVHIVHDDVIMYMFMVAMNG